jgi:hypothetical protein
MIIRSLGRRERELLERALKSSADLEASQGNAVTASLVRGLLANLRGDWSREDTNARRVA